MNGLDQLFAKLTNILQWWIVIAAWERAIRVRHGNKVTVLEPGIHLRIPGLDRIFIQRIKKRYMNTPTQTVTTLDKQALTVSGGTAYCISDIKKLYLTLSDPEDVIQTETMKRVARYISSKNYVDINIEDLELEITKGLDFEQYGLTDVSFVITDFVCVKTYRIIQSNPKDWSSGSALDTRYEKLVGQQQVL